MALRFFALLFQSGGQRLQPLRLRLRLFLLDAQAADKILFAGQFPIEGLHAVVQLETLQVGLSRIQVAFGGLEFRFEELLHRFGLARACLPELLNRQLDLLAEQFLRIIGTGSGHRDINPIPDRITRDRDTAQ